MISKRPVRHILTGSRVTFDTSGKTLANWDHRTICESNALAPPSKPLRQRLGHEWPTQPILETKPVQPGYPGTVRSFRRQRLNGIGAR